MAFKCGNCNKDHLTRKEHIEHLIEVHKSPVYEGDEKDIALSKKILEAKAKQGDKWAEEALLRYD